MPQQENKCLRLSAVLTFINLIVLIAICVFFAVSFKKVNENDKEILTTKSPSEILSQSQIEFNNELSYNYFSKEFKLGSVLKGAIGLKINNDYVKETITSKTKDEIKLNLVSNLPSFALGNISLTITKNNEKLTNNKISCNTYNWQMEGDPLKVEFEDCFSLNDAYWYGGAEAYLQQYWPINNQTYLPHKPYLTGLFGVSSSVMERYWLSSNGVAIIVNQSIPLFVSMNKTAICFLASSNPPYSKHYIVKLSYDICSIDKGQYDDQYLQNFHLNMLNKYYSKPNDIPDELMFKRPIWSTWANYKRDITQNIVIDFAREIKSNDYPNCQLEIDDKWQTEYGDFEFDSKKFPDVKAMVKELNSLGYRTTLWIHPFANVESKNFYIQAFNFYWVRAQNGLFPALTFWWNGLAAVILDTTFNNATNWFVSELKKIQNDYGIDSFKFDAGEIEWLPTDFWLYNTSISPDEYSINYAHMAYELGNMIEVRTACQTQSLPIFVRMLDKDSRWGYDNGLKSVLTTGLLMSILGYPFILPDMIGGNAYGSLGNDTDTFNANLNVTIYPDYELFVRWAQLTAFMPSMQFSIPPWHYNNLTTVKVNDICKKMVNLHENDVYPVLIEFAKKATQTGEPIIRPMWWIDSLDRQNLVIDDQFLVGDKFLVAPILDKGATKRDVYLPKGTWIDGNNNQAKYVGPKWIKDYNAPIEIIPYFISSV